MIKIQNSIPTRAPLPTFLQGLKPESLLDLSWTDPQLGVQDCVWYPEDRHWPELQEGERYTEETLAVDAERKVVVSTRLAEPDPDYLVPEPELKTVFSILEFRERFTQSEQVAIKQLSLIDIEVGLVYDNFLAAQFIDVKDARVGQGLDLYIAKGLLAAQRKKELLAPDFIE